MLISSVAIVNCFAAKTYDTNSSNYDTINNISHAYFTDNDDYPRLEADCTPRDTKFLLSYGQTLYYRIGSYEHPERTVLDFEVAPNGVKYTEQMDMYNTFNGKTITKVLGWYNCQPKTSNKKYNKTTGNTSPKEEENIMSASTKLLSIVLAAILLITGAFALSISALTGVSENHDRPGNGYSKTYFNTSLSKTGGTVNATMTWDGYSYTVWYGTNPYDAQSVRLENWLTFNGSDTPETAGSTVNVSVKSDTTASYPVAQTTSIENNKDAVRHLYERECCYEIKTDFFYVVNGKDFVTQQSMYCYGSVTLDNVVYSMTTV